MPKSNPEYPVTQALGALIGRDHPLYLKAYAMEKWSRNHGYAYRPSKAKARKRTNTNQTELNLNQ